MFKVDPTPENTLAVSYEDFLADNGYIAVSGANGAGVAISQPGVFVAGCASGPKNIKASIAEAQAAASAATVPPDEMRNQIEQLLYALISRPDT